MSSDTEKPENPVDLEEVCLRLLSEWQYLDVKLGSWLKCVKEGLRYPNAFTIGGPNNIPKAYLDKMTCTEYTVTRDTNGRIRNGGRHPVVTLKTFFDNFPSSQKGPFKRFSHRELTYWRLRLRYSCGVLPLVILNMESGLMQRGYDGWKLPSGDIIPFSSLRIANVFVAPESFNIIKTVGEHLPEVLEPIEPVGPCIPGVGPMVLHHILVTEITSAEGEEVKYVVDPTMMQFGIRGPQSGLIWYGPWADFVALFSGKACGSEGIDSPVEGLFEKLWEVGNMQLNHCTDLTTRTLGNLDRSCCVHCGEIDRKGSGIWKAVTLLQCARCQGLKVKYCDRECQKAHWPTHKPNCLPKSSV